LLLVAGVYVCLTFMIEALFAFAERRGTPMRRAV
jgi:polar amino acid transport system permease protein